MGKDLKKIILTVLGFFCLISTSYASESLSNSIIKTMDIQNHISEIGYKLLNANVIEARMIFVYSDKAAKINLEPELTKRQIVVYSKYIQFAKNDDEIAAILARKICKTAESYSGGKGLVSSAQIKLAPKKYEIFFDKRAVDFMVKAGYNPIALITYINKAFPQKRTDAIARTNLTSKRLANIYEYIYTKYPYFLKNNAYIEDEAYQNFLLTSQGNREKLAVKIRNGSKKAVNYD